MSRALAASLVVLAAVSITACGKPPAPPAATTPQVQVVTVAPEDVPMVKTFVGRTAAKNSVELKSNVTGYLLEQCFADGALVKKDAVLFRIDPREFQANLETARAKLAQSESRLAQTQNDFARIEPLAKAGAAPMQELDTAITNRMGAQADLRAAKAAVINAELMLAYTTITAPFDGRMSKGSFSSGTLISPQSGALATIDQIDPITVEFTISEQEILLHQARLAAGVVTSPGKDKLVVEVSMTNGVKAKDTGSIDFADIRIRPETGTALLRAVMPNTTGTLVPGQFVRVGLVGLVRKAALLVPQAAVIQSPTGASLYTIAADGTVAAVPVVLGDWMGERWLVESGLKGGERVVVSGVQKARPGAKVEVVTGEAKPAAAQVEAAPAKAH